MVGPISEAEREAGNRKVKLVLLAIVTVTPPLIALQLDPTPVQLLAAAGAGFLLGLVVVWYLGRLAAEFAGSGRRPRRRR
ncbi:MULTISPECIES: hypothetical protein [Halorubrum]|uniref:Uncharacterized protein n=1 Tax=Halorubrum sodomense TaxID=35743 RepID=A0A1I6FKZ4_HALSD|nr:MULTISPECIES: hypothetical protein [Halorubrum]TKX56161.1 hypothetical protein EXE42_00970 [Halorubrum sp. SP3]TKX67348.1 hypothetical protein EXE45_14415 [Halorubrum sp. SP9]SFR30626.1 hypothetical protein SAMN04487937_0452 [Halorubrum sodomense]